MPLHPRRCTVGARGWCTTAPREFAPGWSAAAVATLINRHRAFANRAQPLTRRFAEKFHMIPCPQNLASATRDPAAAGAELEPDGKESANDYNGLSPDSRGLLEARQGPLPRSRALL
jgi:hypothetical protein